MQAPQDAASDPPVIVLGEPQPRPPVRIRLTRIPFDEFFHLVVEKEGQSPQSEELEAADTRKWFKDHGVTNLDALEKCLDECWNFYEANVVIPADVWRDPKKPFAAFQPQI